MNIYFFEDQTALQFDPISLTRPVQNIRCGPFTFLEWNLQRVPRDAVIHVVVRKDLEDVTREQLPGIEVNPDSFLDGVWVSASAILNENEWAQLLEKPMQCVSEELPVAFHLNAEQATSFFQSRCTITQFQPQGLIAQEIANKPPQYLWEVLPLANNLMAEMESLEKPPGFSDGVTGLNVKDIHIHDSARVFPHVVLNAEEGPIIIDEGASVLPFTYIQGPAVVGNGSTITPHTQYKKSYCGPHCKLGGEINKSIIQGFSNKSHDGYLGDSYIGEWVNLGAGTTNSNLKNNYKPVAVSVQGTPVNTGSLFAGLYMGDHSKTAIGTQFNTGTTVGPACNIVSTDLPPKYIRPFTWYIMGKHRHTLYDKFVDAAQVSMGRRNQSLSTAARILYKSIWEKR